MVRPARLPSANAAVGRPSKVRPPTRNATLIRRKLAPRRLPCFPTVVFLTRGRCCVAAPATDSAAIFFPLPACHGLRGATGDALDHQTEAVACRREPEGRCPHGCEHRPTWPMEMGVSRTPRPKWSGRRYLQVYPAIKSRPQMPHRQDTFCASPVILTAPTGLRAATARHYDAQIRRAEQAPGGRPYSLIRLRERRCCLCQLWRLPPF